MYILRPKVAHNYGHRTRSSSADFDISHPVPIILCRFAGPRADLPLLFTSTTSIIAVTLEGSAAALVLPTFSGPFLENMWHVRYDFTQGGLLGLTCNDKDLTRTLA